MVGGPVNSEGRVEICIGGVCMGESGPRDIMNLAFILIGCGLTDMRTNMGCCLAWCMV